MSADKRNVSTDALATLGTIIEDGGRDAIHLAVEPIVAAEKLYPAQDVGIINGKASSKAEKKLGIVDPFLKTFVPEGSMFWLVVYPRQITSLRHVWEHPDFVGETKHIVDEKFEAEQWLRNFCAESDCPSYERVIAEAVESDGEEYLFFQGSDAHGEIPIEFWMKLEILTGKKLQNPPLHFSCSC